MVESYRRREKKKKESRGGRLLRHKKKREGERTAPLQKTTVEKLPPLPRQKLLPEKPCASELHPAQDKWIGDEGVIMRHESEVRGGSIIFVTHEKVGQKAKILIVRVS